MEGTLLAVIVATHAAERYAEAIIYFLFRQHEQGAPMQPPAVPLCVFRNASGQIVDKSLLGITEFLPHSPPPWSCVVLDDLQGAPGYVQRTWVREDQPNIFQIEAYSPYCVDRTLSQESEEVLIQKARELTALRYEFLKHHWVERKEETSPSYRTAPLPLKYFVAQILRVKGRKKVESRRRATSPSPPRTRP